MNLLDNLLIAVPTLVAVIGIVWDFNHMTGGLIWSSICHTLTVIARAV